MTRQTGFWRAIGRKLRGTSLAKILSATATTFLGILGVGYNAVDSRRKLIERQILQNKKTANELINGALAPLRAHCRDLLRNSPKAIAICDGHKALIVGTGITLEPTGTRENSTALIKDQWNEWQKHCGINGESMAELQAQGISELDGAGEVVWHYIVLPELAERGEIPLRILPLDAEWIVDAPVVADDNFTIVNGIKVDRFGRAVAYALRNPSLDSPSDVKIVEAAHINHIFERDRPLQSRGVPWLTPNIETLKNAQDLIDTELFAAKNSASIAFVVTSEYQDELDDDNHGTAEDPVQSLGLGSAARMFPGDHVDAFNSTRPSQDIAPFQKLLDGICAASSRIPTRFLDRDVGRANYSSMKADQIDTNMILGPVRNWYGNQTAGDAFRHVLPWLGIKAGVSTRGMTFRLIPDEVPYLDPVKDVTGVLLQIAGGMTTWEKEIGKRGGDFKQVQEQLEAELDNPLFAKIFGSNLKAMIGSGEVQALANGETPEDQANNQGTDDNSNEKMFRDKSGQLFKRVSE